ncbi:cupin domain-containing protein [Patescibacteria group bacterium]|nr:cupin domain-containing protein [Patescibacteria group bacterium]
MKIILKGQTKTFKNSATCTAIEYPMGDKDINGAIIELNGRYPDTGWVVNEVCKELVYVIEGAGTLTVEGEEIQLAEGDLALIEPGEKYFFDGHFKLFAPCTPAWYSSQHKTVE